MRYVSTNLPIYAGRPQRGHKPLLVATDGGMFMPAELPLLPKAYFNNIGEMTLREIAFVVANTFSGRISTAPH